MLNITFIYTEPLDRRRLVHARSSRFINDPEKTPADWDASDFLAGVTAPMKDKNGKLYGIPWIADCFMAGCSRYDIFEQAGVEACRTPSTRWCRR